jgi:hypothetical protein
MSNQETIKGIREQLKAIKSHNRHRVQAVAFGI